MAEGIDLLEVGEESLYFDEPCAPEVDALIAQAAQHYAEAAAEPCLLRAYFLAPEQLSVLVALYRYYFYQHRMADALLVAERALEVTARRLHLPGGWSSLGHVALGEAVMRSMERLDEARLRLTRIAEVDERDALGVAPLLALIAARQEQAAAEVSH